MTGSLTVGILYPFHGAEDDYPRMAAQLEPSTNVHVTHTTIEQDAHIVDALKETGSEARLVEGASRLAVEAPDLAAAIWACTSGSFVFGLEGARAQVKPVADVLGVPVSSTSLAFLDAAHALGTTTVAVAATYPDDVAQLFVQLLKDGGIGVVRTRAEGILAALDVGELHEEQVVDLALAADHPDAQAVLIPDTALHTAAWIDRMEEAIGKPVLTANQVSLWQVLRLAGVSRPAARGLGALFAADAGA